MPIVELRCPVGPKRLFSKLIRNDEKPNITSDNLIEFACSDCRKRLKDKGLKYTLVLHRYDLIGNLIETDAITAADSKS